MTVFLLLAALVGPPAPAAAPAPCAEAVAQVKESRRLARDAFFAFAVSFSAQMFDVATTAKAKYDLGCATHNPCLVEENKLFPLTAGLVAGKAAWVALSVMLEYVMDKVLPRTGWLRHAHWAPPAISVGEGGYAGVHNLNQIRALEAK